MLKAVKCSELETIILASPWRIKAEMRQISRDIENIERGNSSTNCLPALLGILSTCNKVFLLQVSDKGGGGSWASAVPIYKYKSAGLYLKAAGENLDTGDQCAVERAECLSGFAVYKMTNVDI